MHTSVDHRESASADRDFAHFTSPTILAWFGSIAVLATPVTAALFDVGTAPGWIATGCAGAVLTVAHLGLQFQAAIFALRDGRWLPGVLAAAICASTMTALYLLAFHQAAGWHVLLVSAVAVAAYVSSVSRRAGPTPL